MAKPLTLDHFLAAHDLMARYYGQKTDTAGFTAAHRALMATAPDMTAELFDWAMQRCMTRCRWMPRLADILQEAYLPDESRLPALPDIDPKFADPYQQGVYWRALSVRQKALEAALPDPRRPRPEAAHLAALMPAQTPLRRLPG
jgi:hypothetical protein